MGMDSQNARAAPPPARPDRREDRVRGDDEQPHVDVVHTDARLDEQHPVEQHEGAHQDGDQPAAEQDARQQVEESGHQRPGDDARQPPGEGVRSDIDGGGGAVRPEDQQVLAIGGHVFGLDIHRHRGGRHAIGQPGVSVDRIPVRLDDVDRPAIARGAGRSGHATQDVDLLGGLVIGHEARRRRQRMAALADRAILGAIAPDGDDVEAGVVRGAVGDVQLRIVDAHHHRQAMGPAGHRQRIGHPGRRGIDERHALARRDRDPSPVHDLDAGQRPVGDGLLDRVPLDAAAGRPQDDLRLGIAGGVQPGAIIARLPVEQVGELRGHRAWIGDRRGRGDEGRPGAGRREVRDPGQVGGAGDGAAIDVHRGDGRVGGRDDRRTVIGDEQMRDGMASVPHLGGLEAALDAIEPDRGQVERRDPAVIETDHELLGGRIHDDRGRPRCRDDAHELAGLEVVAADLRAGRDVDTLAGRSALDDVLASMLDRDVGDRCPERARLIDMVAAPQDQAAGHEVLGQMWVRPLVDVVVQAVPPALQELGRGPRVVDLVKVHLIGLGQAEGAHAEGRQDQDDQDPGIEPVQAAAALVPQGRRAVGAGRALGEAVAEPAAEAGFGERATLGPRGRRDHGSQGGRASSRSHGHPARGPVVDAGCERHAAGPRRDGARFRGSGRRGGVGHAGPW